MEGVGARMATVRLRCAGAEILFYEPDGLLLSSSLLPVDEGHGLHLLTFQLGYLGTGEIGVHVAVDGGAKGQGECPTSAEPPVKAVLLRGAARGRDPAVWLASVMVPDAEVRYRLTVWGQPAADDALRGELLADICGMPPLLVASTKAGITRAPLPKDLPSLSDLLDPPRRSQVGLRSG